MLPTTTFTSFKKGIAIRSTVKRLATSFQISEPVGSYVGRVNYVDFETHDLGPRGEDQALVSFLKGKTKFAHENEVRIVTMNFFIHGLCYLMEANLSVQDWNLKSKAYTLNAVFKD